MSTTFQVFEHGNGQGCLNFLAWLDQRLNRSNGVEHRARGLFHDAGWRANVAMSCIAPAIIRVTLEDDVIHQISIYDKTTVQNNGPAYGNTRNFDNAQLVHWPPLAGDAYTRPSRLFDRFKR
jgi:hypothetical protein